MSKDSLLIELGTEELPPKALKKLALAFRDGIVNALAQRELSHGQVQWFASPRRLAVLIADTLTQAPDKTIEALGPPLDRARDSDGNWTPAATGFARKQGVAPDDLSIADTPKGQRLSFSSTQSGAQLAQEVATIINETLATLPIPKRMRWGANRAEFVRPAHWLVVMQGSQTLSNGSVLGLTPGNTTFGHRFHHPDALPLATADDYSEALQQAYVIASFEERQALIKAQVEAQAEAIGAQAVIDDDLLDEVTALVEWPVALTGGFDQRFLDLPPQALISSMKEHQKYFHVTDSSGQLLPHFITVANIESTDPAQVIEGNERVIRPRLSDAAFFFDTDRKTPLADRVGALNKVVFQQKLGSVGDKSRRVEQLARQLAPLTGADETAAARAAVLAKTDLVSDMVSEFADLQGIAGHYYALHDGETADVALALEEQYLPRHAGDKLPSQAVGTTLALAERLDTLVGIFGIGQTPTGSKDPFALRRASLAVLRILVEGNMAMDLRQCLQTAADLYPDGLLQDSTVDATLAYMIERFRAWFEDEQIPVEVFKAVSAKGLTQPLDIQRRVHAVHQFSQLPEAASLAAANKRVSNILGKLDSSHTFSTVSEDLLLDAAEQNLYKALQPISSEVNKRLQQDDYTTAMRELAQLQQPVDQFFADVMVMADDEKIRNNRLNLLKSLRDLFMQVADISQLVVGK